MPPSVITFHISLSLIFFLSSSQLSVTLIITVVPQTYSMGLLSQPLFKLQLPPLPPLPTPHSPQRLAEQVCLSLLQSCATLPSLHQILSRILKSGLHSNPLVLAKFTSASSLLSASPSLATSLLFAPGAPVHLYDTFLFNTLIRSCADSIGSEKDAVFYYTVMLGCRLLPNKFTFPFLLKACASVQDALMGVQIHAAVLKFGFDEDPYVGNTLVHMYAACGSKGGGVDAARKLFDGMPKTSHVTWSAMIGGYVRSGFSNEAVTLFREMQMAGVRPDEITIVTVLSACADLGALELGRWIGSYVEREKIPKSLQLCNALVDVLAKCGDVDGAIDFFRRMNKKSIVTWTSVIDGLAMHGRGREAVAFFEEMRDSGILPDDVSFVGVLSACSHAGMVDEGCSYFDLMRRNLCIKPKIEHYGCMIDLFSRAGLVERAIDFIKSMPMKPNTVIMRTLIAACRVHGKLELAASITEQLISVEPSQGSNYVLSSNVYASMKQWEKKYDVRNAMSKHGIWKVPGCTLLELGGEIYEFVAGDKSHPHYKEIIEMLEEVKIKLSHAGYKAATSEVLLDIDEEDKEGALRWHSEKLALAFALLRTTSGTPIKIVKNLRVCTDCHSAIKFISKVYKREILMRDRNRFHRFKDGQCTCKDFW